MSQNILITGGTGLVGKELTQKLLQKNYQVRYISRNAGVTKEGIQKHKWDLSANYIDQEAIEWADHVINLAGENVGAGKWNAQRKKAIYDSRIDSVKLLHNAIQKANHKPLSFISASAIGIYGFGDASQPYDENSPSGDDFLAIVTKDWEKEMDKVADLGIRTVKLRIGVVLSKDGGALPKIVKPIKLFAGAPLGDGNQLMSWIHIDDLIDIFVQSIEKSTFQDAYNAVAPNPVSNKEFTKSAAKILKKPLWLPNVPAFVLKTILGEMSLIALRGSYISCQKLIDSGFNFSFKNHTTALEEILSH